MLPRRKSLGSRFWSGPLLVLSASCLWGCPQLLSDEFMLGNTPDPSGQFPSVLDTSGDDTTGGAAGASGSAGSTGRAGTGGSAGSSDAPNVSNAGGAGGAPVSVAGAPTVVNVSPPNGASGVAADAVVTLTFSEPMDTGAVYAAYSSSDLPASSVDFNWSEGNTLLQITPKQPLTRASGTDPAKTTAERYAFEIGTAAVDMQGEALPRFSSSFTTLREIRLTLDAVQDRSLTGNWRSDNTYGDNSCEQSGSTTTCTGDSSNDNSTYRGFVTFDLSGLPAAAQALSSAQLSMTIDNIRGSPYPALGKLLAERVSFDSISLDAFNAAALGSAVELGSPAPGVGAQLSADVLASVQSDLPARGHSQLRLRFSTTTNSDDSGDLIEVKWATEKLALVYLLP